MKKFLFVLQFSLVSFFGFGQSVTLECPGGVEVGIPGVFTAKFNANGSPNITIVSYEWSVAFNGPGQSGQSGIVGNTNGATTFANPYRVFTSNNMNTITIKWGDLFNICHDQVFVDVNFIEKDTSGTISNRVLSKNCLVEVFCVHPPFIEGPSSIQECCHNLLTYCDNSLGNQDTWNWTVTGGTIVSGQGTRCISVNPNNLGALVVSSTAGRKTGITTYTRSSSSNVSRYTPKTPEITGPSITCDGNEISLCVEPLCGMSGVNWIVPNNFTLLSGQGSTCAIVKPNPQPNGSAGIITSQMQFQGGCLALPSSKTIKVFTTEIPPCPVGYPTIIFEYDYDPCDHDGTAYTINYITNKPYLNGVTTITPSVVIDVPHHNVTDRFNVKVCNKNLCSGLSCCKNYLVFLPAPCFNDDGIKPLVSNDDEVILTDKEFLETRSNIHGKKNKPLIIFPNPAQNNLRIESTSLLNGKLDIYDLIGKSVFQNKLENTTSLNLDISNISENGVYFLVISSNGGFETHKLIINR